MSIYLNISRDGRVKITENAPLEAETAGSLNYLWRALPEKYSLEEVYAAVIPEVQWKDRQFYVPEIDIADDDEVMDEVANFIDLIVTTLRHREAHELHPAQN